MAIAGGSGHVTQVSDSVLFPELSQLTLCLEAERTNQKQVGEKHRGDVDTLLKVLDLSELWLLPPSGAAATRGSGCGEWFNRGVTAVTPADPFLPRPLQEEWIFTYSDSSGQVALSFGWDQNGVRLIVGGASCSMDSIISASHFTSYMKPVCILWASSNGQVGVYVDGTFRTETCSTSIGHLVPAGGRFQLGGQCDVSTGSASPPQHSHTAGPFPVCSG